MKKYITGLVFGLLVTASLAQQSINDYSYVVVPKQFGFQKSAGEYNLNALAEFLFKKYGFDAYLEGEVPNALMSKPCEGLRANVVNESGMFITKVKVTLTNCSNTVLFESKEGKSKEKLYDKAYNLAIREAFEDVEALDYKYTGSTVQAVQAAPTASAEVAVAAPVAVIDEPKQVEAKGTLDGDLIAIKFQTINYEVYNSEHKLVMTLLYTPATNVYIVKGQDAILYKMENGLWIYYMTKGTEMTSKAVSITFK